MNLLASVPPFFGLDGIPKNLAQAMDASPTLLLGPKSNTAASVVLPVAVVKRPAHNRVLKSASEGERQEHGKNRRRRGNSRGRNYKTKKTDV